MVHVTQVNSPKPLPQSDIDASLSFQSKTVREIFNRASEERKKAKEAPRTAFSKGRETLVCSLDALSEVANTASAVGTFVAGAGIALGVGALGLVRGVGNIFAGIGLAKASADELKEAIDHKNVEGGVANTMGISAGVSLSTVGGGILTAQTGTFAALGVVAAVGTIIFNAAAFVLYTLFGTMAGYRLAINLDFREQFNKALGGHGIGGWAGGLDLDKGMTPEDKDKLLDALKLIQKEIGLGPNTDLNEKLNPDEQKKLETELQKKWDQFASRTSEESCRYARENITNLIENVKKGDTLRAVAFLQDVKRANNKKLAADGLLMTIAILGITALTLGLVFATGPYSPIIFAAVAGLWFFLDSSHVKEKTGNLLFGKPNVVVLDPPEPAPGSDRKAAP